MKIQYDYSEFDPEAGASPTFPPEGEGYTFQLINLKDDLTRSGDRKVTVEFRVHGGEHHNTTFPLGYNIGHSNATTRQIAFEGLGKLYYGITGQKPPATGFDVSKLLNGYFMADLKVTVGDKYTNADLRNIKPAEGTQTHHQPEALAAPAPTVTGKPAWAN